MWNWEEQINGVNSIAFASYISMCWIGGGMCEYSKQKESVVVKLSMQLGICWTSIFNCDVGVSTFWFKLDHAQLLKDWVALLGLMER